MDFPTVLYHYTTADGLIGIIQSRNMWLTDYRSLNDQSEIIYALELIKEVVGKYIQENSIPEISEWQSIFREDHQGELLFVGSFAQAADNPVLWRLYSKQKGYVLGMQTASLQEILSNTSNANLQRVIYDRDGQKIYIEEKFIEFQKERLSVKHGHDLRDSFNRQMDRINFFFWLYQIAPFIKHSSFEHENEWRIALHFRSNSGVKFRSRDEDVVPYFELPMFLAGNDRSWLKSIDIGPGVDASRNIAQLEALLDQNGFAKGSVKFGRSLIPLR